MPSVIELFLDLKTLKDKIDFIGPNSFCVMAIIKYSLLVIRSEEIKACIDTVIADWCEVVAKEEREIMIRNARIARVLTVVCVVCMFSSGIFHGIFLPLLTTASLLRENVTYGVLPYNGHFLLFDAHVRPYYGVVFFLQAVFGFVMYAVTSGVCSLAAKFVMHICGQCQVITYLLENLVDDGDNFAVTLESRVTAVIVRHLHVLKFVESVESVLNDMCLVELLGCTLSMCLLGYHCITGWEDADVLKLFTFFILLVSVSFNIFIFCYIGELLTNHCQQIGEASYMIDWYRLPGIQARFLTLLIAVGNRPVKLTTGKMADLSFTCFCNIVKSAMAYLNMLRTTTSS